MRWWLIIAVGLASLLVACGGSGRKKTASIPSTAIGLSVEIFKAPAVSLRDTVNMGRMREGEKVVKEVAVKNNGETPFVITDIQLGCGCLSIKHSKEPIMPGTVGIVDVELDSRGYIGYIVKEATVKTSLSDKGFVLVFEAEVQ